jgi:hypothetical protein
MGSVRIEQKSYEMPPSDGFTVTHFITVADIDRSADFYAKVFGGRILSRGDSKGASGHIQIANTPTSRKADARPRWDADLSPGGCGSEL